MSKAYTKWLKRTIAEMQEHAELFPGDIDADHGKVLKALRIALASLETEPVAYIGERMLADLIDGARSCGRIWPEVTDKMSGEDRIPLFLAPPAPVSVPTFKEWCERTEQKPVGWVRDAMKEAYDGCRAAMQGKVQPATDNTAQQFEALTTSAGSGKP